MDIDEAHVKIGVFGSKTPAPTARFNGVQDFDAMFSLSGVQFGLDGVHCMVGTEKPSAKRVA